MSGIIAEGLTATIIGMGIVLAVLALLAVILSFFKYLNPQEKPAEVAKSSPHEDLEVEAVEVFEETEIVTQSAQTDASELYAVIAAAVAVCTESGMSVPVIRSITPVAAGITQPPVAVRKAWNTSAIRENHRGLY